MPPYQSPQAIVLSRPRWAKSWINRQGKRAHSRLLREFEMFRIDFAFLQSRGHATEIAWIEGVNDQLEKLKTYLEHGDVEGGWYALHAAKRLATWGRSDDELVDCAKILRKEAQRLTTWRGQAIACLIPEGKDDQLTPSRIIDAMTILDENSSNRYHMIWLLSDQLRLVFIICLIATLLCAIACIIERWIGSRVVGIWRCDTIGPALLLGVFGAAFSTTQSLFVASATARIPELVANLYVTTARVLLGCIAGLAGYFFYISRLINITVGNVNDPVANLAATLAVAFLFGYSGERLVARVAGSIDHETP